MRVEIQERIYAFSLNVARYVLARHESARTPARAWLTQLGNAATSVAANFEEAHAASSKADFTAKVAISRKEATEAAYWFRLLCDLDPADAEAHRLQRESNELARILSAITRRARRG